VNRTMGVVSVSGDAARDIAPDERSLRIWLPLTKIWTRTFGGRARSERPRGRAVQRHTSQLV